MSRETRGITVADTLLPAHSAAIGMGIAISFSIVIALAAQVAVRLPFTPVPITGQTFAVLLTGALLGSRLGALALLFYLLEGVAGLPVFAGGSAGPGQLVGPTGGYLIGFVLAAFAVGWLAERKWDRSFGSAVVAMLAGEVLIYACGLVWLSKFVPGGSLVSAGLLPFVVGDVAKLLVAAAAMPVGWKALSAYGLLGRQGQ